MPQFIMLHHSLNLYYIDHCLTKINKLLQHQQVTEPSAIYYKLYVLLDQMNASFGPAIFCILVCTLVLNSTFSYNIISIFKELEFSEVFFFFAGESIVYFLMSFDLLLYYLICDQLCETTKKIDNIILEKMATVKDEEVGVLFISKF
ncbi:hypothetical protein CVS40_5544 [Lucilia cuprina]|nr:hypothetical protein CVS40_5544 [Lucilia cuprina]